MRDKIEAERKAVKWIASIKRGSLKKRYAEMILEWYVAGCSTPHPRMLREDEAVKVEGDLTGLHVFQAMFKNKRSMVAFYLYINRRDGDWFVIPSAVRYHDEKAVDEKMMVLFSSKKNGED